LPLPDPRNPGTPYAIAMICLGNICRSPIAEVVLTARLKAAGLEQAVRVGSFGTGGWHSGEPMDRRAAATLTTSGYDASLHRARQFEGARVAGHDLLLAMDRSNYLDVLGLVEETEHDRVHMYRSFDPLADANDCDVPDPWYGGPEGFEDVLAMVERTTDRLVVELQAKVGPH
jgi:protein-tyrosine phosphatase